MAMTNLSAVPASHIFQASDKPYYHKGFKVLFIMAAMAISVMVAMRFAYQWLNRRIEEGKGTVEGGEVDRGFRYQLWGMVVKEWGVLIDWLIDWLEGVIGTWKSFYGMINKF